MLYHLSLHLSSCDWFILLHWEKWAFGGDTEWLFAQSTLHLIIHVNFDTYDSFIHPQKEWRAKRESGKKRVRKRTAPTPVRWQNRWPNLNTAPQVPKTVGWHYVCVCSHACALSCFCVNVHSDEVRSELRGGALPATQRQTAGRTFKSWGLAPVGLRICPRIVSSRPYCM